MKCRKLGLRVLVAERAGPGRHKVCGGVVPGACADVLSDLGLTIPLEALSSPASIGLYYVPPSGRKNGGSVRDYELLNLRRDPFDWWLCECAKDAGVEVLHETEFLDFVGNEVLEVSLRSRGRRLRFASRYLVGADGVHSRVRRLLYPDVRAETRTVMQESWRAVGDFENFFYIFLRGAVTPTYGYVIPKDGWLVVGTAVPADGGSVSRCMSLFRSWLGEEFGFEPVSMVGREVASIPGGALERNGKGNVILVGDAAGFCNAFSGEGIRLALESGILVGESVACAEDGGQSLSSVYSGLVSGIRRFVERTVELSRGMSDESRELFARSELCRLIP
jgi:flavin-dependent dehydrogenase